MIVTRWLNSLFSTDNFTNSDLVIALGQSFDKCDSRAVSTHCTRDWVNKSVILSRNCAKTIELLLRLFTTINKRTIIIKTNYDASLLYPYRTSKLRWAPFCSQDEDRARYFLTLLKLSYPAPNVYRFPWAMCGDAWTTLCCFMMSWSRDCESAPVYISPNRSNWLRF